MPVEEFSAHEVASLLLLLDAAECGSITAAAEKWNITVSAASQRISKLERHAGQPLVIRQARGIALTQAGLALVEHARKIREQLRLAQGSLSSFLGLESGRIRLGSFPTASASLVSDVVVGFRRRYPKIELSVHSALRQELVDMLQTGTLEMSALWSYQAGTDLPPDLRFTVLGEDPNVLLVPAGYPEQGALRLEDLVTQDWLTRTQDHPATAVLSTVCEQVGVEPSIVYLAHDYAEMQAMVAAGLGIAMVPKMAMEHHRSDVKTLPLPPDPRIPTRSILLATHARRQDSPAMRALRRIMARTAAGQLQPLPRAHDERPDNSLDELP